MLHAHGIRVGIGGWTYGSWRGVFYPPGLIQRRELEYASSRLSSIEINGTFYGAQKPEAFARWRQETPPDFIFSLKAPRYATHRRSLSSAGPSIERFLGGGILELKEKLGPINWQLSADTPFSPSDFDAFLRLLPRSAQGRALSHAVEVRHESFRVAECVEIARRHGVALVIAADGAYPRFSDVTASFVYVRLMGSRPGEPLGYPGHELDRWAQRALGWAEGAIPEDPQPALTSAHACTERRKVFVYFISGHKVSNPAAAQALMQRIQ